METREATGIGFISTIFDQIAGKKGGFRQRVLNVKELPVMRTTERNSLKTRKGTTNVREFWQSLEKRKTRSSTLPECFTIARCNGQKSGERHLTSRENGFKNDLIEGYVKSLESHFSSMTFGSREVGILPAPLSHLSTRSTREKGTLSRIRRSCASSIILQKACSNTRTSSHSPKL